MRVGRLVLQRCIAAIDRVRRVVLACSSWGQFGISQGCEKVVSISWSSLWRSVRCGQLTAGTETSWGVSVAHSFSVRCRSSVGPLPTAEGRTDPIGGFANLAQCQIFTIGPRSYHQSHVYSSYFRYLS